MKQREWDTTSIEGMENTAASEADRNCSVKVGDHWLEVIYDTKPLKREDRFKYKWGKNYVKRESALEVFKMREQR